MKWTISPAAMTLLPFSVRPFILLSSPSVLLQTSSPWQIEFQPRICLISLKKWAGEHRGEARMRSHACRHDDPPVSGRKKSVDLELPDVLTEMDRVAT